MFLGKKNITTEPSVFRGKNITKNPMSSPLIDGDV
jgi:hypothetical protein